MTSPMQGARPCRDGCGAPVILRRRAENTKRWIVLDATPVSSRRGGDVRHVRGRFAYTPEQLAADESPLTALAFERAPRVTGSTVHTVHACPKGASRP